MKAWEKRKKEIFDFLAQTGCPRECGLKDRPYCDKDNLTEGCNQCWTEALNEEADDE